MSAPRSRRWSVVLFCAVLGTLLGIFLQRFAPTASFFRDFEKISIAISQVDLIALRFGFQFSLRVNLGTFLGCIAGFFVAR